jgi:diguanylate cyclase (GGDEF)-like protein
MKRFLSPTLQISLGLLSLTVSLIFIAYSFGLVPNEEKATLEARARISENLAVQLANLAGRNDTASIKDTIASVTSRDADVLSVGVRSEAGKLLVSSENHEALWGESSDSKSTPTHVQVPLVNGDKPEGRIEIVFRPLPSSESMLGLSESMSGFIGFIVIAGFAGYYFILRRALRELDPGRAIPERVKSAFDTLAEGVLIMDENEFVLLANNAFMSNICPDFPSLLGTKANELPWVSSRTGSPVPDLPWRVAIYSETPVLGMPLSIADSSGQLKQLTVNATRILDAKGAVRGLIATFDDVSVLHRTNEQLNLSIEQLHRSQLMISEQNQKLTVLASSDPLTGCLNRRTFFAEADRALAYCFAQHQPLSFLMLDVDHFKSINDRFGHTVGDKVLVGLVDVLKQTCHGSDLIGRYGGEEFCIVVVGLQQPDVIQLTEKMRLAVAGVDTWLPNEERVTISIGIASLDSRPCDIAELVKRADEALYAAKTTGRNRFVTWDNMPLKPEIQLGSATRQGQHGLAVHVPSAAIAPIAFDDNSLNLPDLDLAFEHVESIIRDDRGHRLFALGCIDIDNFRQFNEVYGQDMGDALLIKIGERIVERLRRGDMLVRLSSDEFLVLLDPIESRDHSRAIFNEILNDLKQPFMVNGSELFSSCSMGVALYPDHGAKYEVLRRHADAAMYHAKQISRGDVVYFDNSMTEASTARTEAEQRLRLAIRDRKFCCAFQPKVELSDERVVGFEALVRWRDDDGELHLPGEFVGLATELGLIGQITNYVLDIVINSIDRLDAAFEGKTSISVNLAAKLANDLDFMMPFTQALRESMRAERIVLELTEDAFIAKGAFHTTVVPILRELGVRISIDDFGTGYSSLHALADITADELKIDRSFITSIHKRPRSQSVLRAINSLGDALQMTIVAEGVETYEELAYLRAATTIRQVQGYYFSKPFYLEDIGSQRYAETEGRRFEPSRPSEPSRNVSTRGQRRSY